MKYLVATIVYKADRITNECFVKSLFNQCNEMQFDLFIASTSENDFAISPEFKSKPNVKICNFSTQYKISEHGLAIQKILDLFGRLYDNIIICENDTVVKKDLIGLIDREFQFAGQTNGERGWWTTLHKKLHIRCDRWMPMLQYFNMNAFPDRKVCYEIQDAAITFSVPSLSINERRNGHMICDPGWYFMLWAEKNSIKCKNIDIGEYISHFWFGSEHRTKDKSEYEKRLYEFKKENVVYLK